MNVNFKHPRLGFKALVAAGALGALSLVASAAHANVVFTGSDGLGHSASADFSLVGGNLQVVLTNTSAADVLVPTDVLTAVFFTNGSTLTPISALLAPGSTVFFGSQGSPTAGNVGGEWAYGAGLAGAPGGATNGISSSGYGLFGGPNFSGDNLQDPLALDGLQYGLTSAGDNTATGNSPVTGDNALIKNSVVFTLGITNLSGLLSNVSFQYGTALEDRNIPGTTCLGCSPSLTSVDVPEPASLAIFGTALVGLGLLARRRNRRNEV